MNEIVETYKKYFKSVFDFMVERGYTKMPYPKVVLDNTDQHNSIFMKTGYFDPANDLIKIFINGRAVKDCVRSFCHESLHHGQHIDGIIEKSGYSSDKITEDKNLVRLEAEAYLKGNMAFRSWTEIEKKKGKLK